MQTMIWERPTGLFEVKPNPWVASAVVADVPTPSWRDDPERKRRFAEALQTAATPFDAALVVFGRDTASALWASVHWLADPIVQAIKKDVAANNKILDKDQLCHKLLNISEEKSPQGYYIIEAKDRIACIKLYAEIQGYLNKETTTFNNFANNNLKVVFVKPDNDHHKIKTIDNQPDDQEPSTDEVEEDNSVELENNLKPLPKLRMV